MATDDVLARARAAIAHLRGVCEAATPGPWMHDDGVFTIMAPGVFVAEMVLAPAHEATFWQDAELIPSLRNAAAPLLALAEAAERLIENVASDGGDVAWWAWAKCLGCDAVAMPPNCTRYDHAPDCPALAIDRALADLAALSGEGDGV